MRAALKVDDFTRFDRIWAQPADHISVAAGRHKTDVLAVLLVGDGQAEAQRQFARLRFCHVAQREAEILELLTRGREQEIALVAICVGCTNQCAPSVAASARGYIMSGRQGIGAKLARGSQEIAELDRAVALDTGDRSLA